VRANDAMDKLAQLKSADQAGAGGPDDPVTRLAQERAAFAQAVAIRVIAYRLDNELSQTQLARLLDTHQPAIARLEAGGHEPSLATLRKLARCLGIEFHIEITPGSLGLRDTA